ncbi:MAG: metallophosphoesterase [Acetobacteraceae bacterium]|nr:metallophosphoesterase [Acetobacteraceae bacterium]
MLRRAALALPLAATLPVYALGVEPLRLTTPRYAVPWSGPRLRVALLADLHAGAPCMTAARVQGIVEATNALRPDLTLLLGDYGQTSRRVAWAGTYQPAEIAPLLGRLTAPLGVFAVAGNHDWWDDRAAMRRRGGRPEWLRALAAAGIAPLQNEVAALPGFWLGGLDSQWAWSHRSGADDLPGLLARVPEGAPLLLAAHEPDIFAGGSPRVALQVSGHTHGGQVRLAGWSPRVPSAHGNRYAHGHIVEDGRHLVVSAGLGLSELPVRLGAPPEVPVVTLG